MQARTAGNAAWTDDIVLERGEDMESIVAVQVADATAMYAKLDELCEKVNLLLAERDSPVPTGANPNSMTTAEAAVYLGMSKGQLNKSRIKTANACDGPPYHATGGKGSKVYYVKSELDEWRAASKIKAGRVMTKMEQRLAAIERGGKS